MENEGVTPDVDKIRGLADLMERYGLSRLCLEEDGLMIRLEAGGPAQTVPPSTTMPAAWPPPVSVPASPPPAVVPEPKQPVGVPLPSPTTGAFFRAPSPADPPFVEVGDRVSVGQTIGIIMAMKVMSEVPAETAGIVTAIPARDGEMVQSGEPLVFIDPAG